MTSWQQLPSGPSIALSSHGGALRIQLRRPEQLNALDNHTSEQLLAVLRRAAEDDSVRSVLLTGTGRAFCAGADIGSQFSDPDARAAVKQGMKDRTAPTILALRQLPKPVIAAVNGAAAGLGCSIALACDLVLAADTAYFLLAFANLGLTVDGGASLIVPARVGLGRAFVMSLLAERVPAPEALAWGLADRVVPDAELAAVSEALALRLAAGPTRSYAATKHAINKAQLSTLGAQLDLETELQGELLASEDFDEGVKAFTAKRTPSFRGV